MAIPQLLRVYVESRLRAHCEAKAPTHVRDKLRYGFRIRGSSVTFFSERVKLREPEAPWIESVIAQFRYDAESEKWTLYCADRNSRWHVYDQCKPSKSIDDLLRAVDEDVTGIFFG